MFAKRYFANRMFAKRYWNNGSTGAPPVTSDSTNPLMLMGMY